MGHFFFDAMLRVTLFERLDDFRFLVPPVLQPWHRGLFEVAGIQPHQLVNAEEGVTCVEELVGCHIATEGSMPRAELLRKFRDIALANAVTTPPARRNRRIFIDRSAAKRRKMANQKELERCSPSADSRSCSGSSFPCPNKCVSLRKRKSWLALMAPVF
ncbi:MAG: hypothetical protein WDN28_28195 [Chthoniobacter sp.]